MGKTKEDKRTFKRTGLRLDVFPNRLEITSGLPPYRSKDVIPMSNVASVKVTKATRKLVITTNDGKERGLQLGGGVRGKPFKARDAIIENMI